MKRFFVFIGFTLLILNMSSCKEKVTTVRMIKVTEHSSSKISDTTLIHLLNKENKVNISIRYTLSEDEALAALEAKKADFVIIPNNAMSSNINIKAMLPLLPRVLMILTNKQTDYKHIRNLLKNGTLYLEDMSRLDTLFFRKVFNNFDVDVDVDVDKIVMRHVNELDIKEYTESDSLKIYMGLTHMKNKVVTKLIENGWSFYSLDEVDNFGKGSRVEGFCLFDISANPFIIPRSIFRGKPDKAILTISINDILITRNDIPHELVYNITKSLIENRSELIRLNNKYNLLNFNFDPQDIAFSLHKGTLDYLNRDKPPIWLEYIKMVWPVLSVSVVIFGFIASFRQRLRRMKKQNIEMYYNTLLEIREKSDETINVNDLRELLKKTRSLRAEAIKSLANKKLDPGESFNIFLALQNEVKDDIITRIRETVEKEKSEKDKVTQESKSGNKKT